MVQTERETGALRGQFARQAAVQASAAAQAESARAQAEQLSRKAMQAVPAPEAVPVPGRRGFLPFPVQAVPVQPIFTGRAVTTNGLLSNNVCKGYCKNWIAFIQPGMRMLAENTGKGRNVARSLAFCCKIQ